MQTVIRANPDERLRAVIERVRKRCGISDRYTGFSGDQSVEEGGARWRLRWWNENGAFSVTCGDDGYPSQLSRSESRLREYEPYFAPCVPGDDLESLRDAAQAFLNNALRENEDYRLKIPEKQLNLNPGGGVYLEGRLLGEGLRTDIRCTLELDRKETTVRSFWRSDGWQRLIEADELLKGAVRPTLQYVSDGESRAELRYAPEDAGHYWRFPERCTT